MKQWSDEAAVAVVGLAAIELWKAYRSTAPSISDARAAEPGDLAIRQRLLDSDITVGSLALIIGVALAVMMKDVTAMLIMIVIFASLSFLHHWVLAAPSR